MGPISGPRTPTDRTWQGVQIEYSGGVAHRPISHDLIAAPNLLLVGAEGLAQLPAGVVTTPLVAVGFDSSAHLMPHLIEFQSQTDAVQADILEALAGNTLDAEVPYCALLDTPIEAAALHKHLRQQQRVSHGSEIAWLRLHDPYVTAHLPRAVGTAGLRRIMGPVERWHLRLGDQWLTLNRPPPPVGLSPAATELETPASWHRLKRIGAVNRALGLCGLLHLEGVLAHAHHLDALVARAIASASLADPNDQARYAQLGLFLDPAFDEHPLVTAALGTPSGEPLGLLERLEALPAVVWGSLARDCPRRDASPSIDTETRP